MRLKPFLLTGMALAAALFNAPEAFAYGGGSSSSKRCSEPKFYDEVPAKDSVVKSLAEVAIVASDDTDMSTLELDVDGQKLKPEMTQQRSGAWLLRAKLPQALTRVGKVRIALVAKSNNGCSGYYPYFLEIRP